MSQYEFIHVHTALCHLSHVLSGFLIAQSLAFHDPSRFGDFISSVHCISCKALRFLLSRLNDFSLPTIFPSLLVLRNLFAQNGLRGDPGHLAFAASAELKPSVAPPWRHLGFRWWRGLLAGRFNWKFNRFNMDSLSSKNWRIPATLKSHDPHHLSGKRPF